jgi:hypothetical protein
MKISCSRHFWQLVWQDSVKNNSDVDSRDNFKNWPNLIFHDYLRDTSVSTCPLSWTLTFPFFFLYGGFKISFQRRNEYESKIEGILFVRFFMMKPLQKLSGCSVQYFCEVYVIIFIRESSIYSLFFCSTNIKGVVLQCLLVTSSKNSYFWFYEAFLKVSRITNRYFSYP